MIFDHKIRTMIYGMWSLCKNIILLVNLKNNITDQCQENACDDKTEKTQKSFK